MIAPLTGFLIALSAVLWVVMPLFRGQPSAERRAPSPRFCSACDTPLEPDANFCAECGAAAAR
jgi:predicted amidophosphoribosyltransferase